MRNEPLSRRVVVHGHVQGVYFRDTCRREAQRAGVTGWVRNDPDGSVSALFEGPATAVEQMVGWCHEGPPRARVDRVDVAEAPVAGAATFDVQD
jgi:acylphosphatase